MKSAVENLSPTRAKLTIEVPFEELKPSLDKAYKKIAQQINVPGFRRGKVPPTVIDRQVGRAVVLDEAVNEVVPQKYAEAMQEHSLEPLAQPEIEVTKFEDHETLEFTAEVDVKPDFELPAYDALEAKVDDIELSDDEVAEQVEALRERFGSLVDVERAAADGDFVTIDLTAAKDGETVEGGEVSGMSYKVGRGGMLEGLDEALVGMAAGDEKTFASELVGGDLIGEAVDVTVKVTAVQEQELPELDDEFAQLASEFDTVEELTADVKERLGRGKRLEQAAAARDAVLEALLEKVTVPLPETMVTDELNSRRESVEQQLMYAGLTMEKYLEDEGQTDRGVRGRPRPPGPRRRRRAVHPRRDREEGGDRRRPAGPVEPPRPSRPAVGSGPAGVREPHVRAQPHPRHGAGDPARQGAGDPGRVGHGARTPRATSSSWPTCCPTARSVIPPPLRWTPSPPPTTLRLPSRTDTRLTQRPTHSCVGRRAGSGGSKG